MKFAKLFFCPPVLDEGYVACFVGFGGFHVLGSAEAFVKIFGWRGHLFVAVGIVKLAVDVAHPNNVIPLAAWDMELLTDVMSGAFAWTTDDLF